ncbi:extracellular matrix protein 3-like [Diadema setosum]|uniref:extracellular matrix protein 3-like n=1 Tax=Diadema setosum TaxID=31175 RepID=UPI003B3B8AB6
MASALLCFVIAILPALIAGQGTWVLGTSDVRTVEPVNPVNGGTDLDGSSGIIVRNTGIAVPFGREKAIDPVTELTINVDRDAGHVCYVTVLPDPLSQVPGRLVPKMFPCDFGPGEVKYVHFGSRKPQRDRVRLQLRYDSLDETTIIPFMIDVKVESKQLQIVTQNIPLEVELMGESDNLDSTKLGFAYDRETEVCKVTVLSSSSGLPRYGEVIDNANQGQMIDCESFLTPGIRYRHTAQTSSPREDYIPLVVELQSSQSGEVIRQEYFQSMVRIENGLENTPPGVDLQATMIMEVDQFVMTAITPEILMAEDAETPVDMLVFNITSPLGPGEGYIVSTDDRNLPLSSFTQKDIRDLKIAYVPPADDSNVQRIFQLELEVVDSELATSVPFTFMIVVKPKNTLAPVVTRNTGLTLFEGQSRPLLTYQNLEISDEDNLQDVIIAPINGSRHGELRIGGQRIKQFTIADLIEGAVTYHHYGTDTYSDNIIFRMTDGSNEVEFLFPIIIAPIDDEAPIVDVNTGIVVNEGGEVQITQFVLSATDIDSDDSQIRFVLEQPYSDQGSLFLRQLDIPADPQNWIIQGNFYERETTEFTLDDILNGHLFYRHGGIHNQDPVFDRMLFRVIDAAEPQPNESPVQEFVVKVMPQDLQPPEVFVGTTLQLVVDEFQITPIVKKNMRYTDLDSNDRDLKYTIISPLSDIDPSNPLPTGDIVLTDDPDTPITMFTQAQINHLKVSYKPPSTELGIATRLIEFQFVVQDSQGNMAAPQRFLIFLRPVDNKPPTITNTGIQVFERGTITIDQTMLDATDPDTDRSTIRVIVVQEPQFGSITLEGIPLQQGDEFTLTDIEQGYVQYVSSGAEEEGDLVNLEITDGVHVVPITIHVAVEPIDDEAPTLDLPPGTIGSFLEVQENSFSLITSNILSASDPDTEDLLLTFIVDREPTEGKIQSNSIDTLIFTQQDIVNGLVRYVHTSGEIGPTKREDSFNLTLSDMSPDWVVGGNQITQVEVFVTILPVDNLAPNVTMGIQFYVDEAGKGNINMTHLQAPDVDTEDDDVLCTIVVNPNVGYLENIAPAPGSEKSRAGMPISAFSIKDLRLNHINYVQSIHLGVEPDEDQFTFRCTDGVNESPNFLFPININPTNDEKPTVYAREIIVEEGSRTRIDSPLLNAEDRDVPAQELHFFIVSPPEHGTILYARPGGDIPILNFTMDQILTGNDILYEHDDSETTEDSFTVLLTDGKYEVNKEILVMIIPRDDETPRLTINDGLDIEIGDIRVINNRILKATDLDSPDSNLTYTVRFGPDQGLLQRLDKFDGSVVQNITLGMNFTQWEVDNGRIRYVHTGATGGRDLIKFDITDGENPLIDRYFYVSIDHIDNVHPSIINAGVTMQEGGRVTLTTSIISTSDLNSPDEDLLFTITRAPSKGHLESTDNPGMPINSFTQLDLAGNKIYYVHTADDEVRMDSFQFEVTDGFNTVVRTFRIALTDVDNKEPVVEYTTVRLQEGENKLITPFELRIDDRDTLDDSLLRFTITQLPIHGNLLRNNTELVTEFTMHDINENLISYQHDGSESTTDSFSFIVSDGTHNEFYVLPDITTLTRQPQQVPIEIVPVDNGAPQIVVNRGAPTLDALGTGDLGFMITNKYLMAEDRDSVDNSLLYVITTQPRYGYLMNIALGNVSITNFTQSKSRL